MHRIVHLDAFPAMVVVIFVEDKVQRGPTGGEECVVTLLVRHVHQLVDLAPVVPLEAAVEYRIAFQGGILVNERAVRNSGAAGAAE